MPRRYDEEDDEYGSDEYDAYRDYDPEDPETYPAGVYDDDGPPTVPCPYCKREIAEDSERCPHCENYLTGEERPTGSTPRSGFWLVMMILAMFAALLWAVG